MKRKLIVSWLFILMLVAVAGIVTAVVGNFDVIKAAFGENTGGFFGTEKQLCFSLALMILCWAALFVMFVRAFVGGSFFDYGRRDKLTGIGNKSQLEFHYKRQKASYNQVRYVAYFSFNIKKISSIFGDETAVKLEKAMAKILEEKCNKQDCVARIEEGVFAVCVFCADGLRAQQRLADMVDSLNECQNKILFKVISPVRCGFCLGDSRAVNFPTAYKRARTAYESAANSGSKLFLFTDEMATTGKEQKLLRKKLLKGMENQEFKMFLQFIFDVKKQEFVSVEALSRWNSPQDGFVMPTQYIKDMHKCGIIENFDMYMLQKACELLENWKNDSDFSDFTLSCNITRVTISSGKFLENFRNLEKKYDFPHHNLILEITEDALINDQYVANENIVALRRDGYQIALDDFGAGNSSFSDINNYPVDLIKIDRSFINTALEKTGQAVLHALIGMAHDLNVAVVCEGVETKEQRNAVTKMGCDLIQGHFFSYVYPIDEAKEMYYSSKNTFKSK